MAGVGGAAFVSGSGGGKSCNGTCSHTTVNAVPAKIAIQKKNDKAKNLFSLHRKLMRERSPARAHTHVCSISMYFFSDVNIPLSAYFTDDIFDMLVSKFAISGAMYCVAANHECTYSPV